MTQQPDIITRRLKQIDKERAALDVEYALLVSIQYKFAKHSHLLKKNDVFSQRNAAKFELLALVADYLGNPDLVLFGGASTRELYDAVQGAVVQKAVQTAASNLSRYVESAGDQLKDRDPGTPLTNASEPFNYNTFRSYLTRFKEEGRIFYDERTRRWSIDNTKEGYAETDKF